MPGLAGIALALTLWEFLARSGVLPGRAFPPITEIAPVLAAQLRGGELWPDLGQTLEGWAIGLAIAAGLAIPAGLAVGSSALAYGLLRSLIEFLRPIPSVALIPLVVLLYGTGIRTKLVLIVFAAFWPILFQAIYGVQDVDPVATDTARSFGVGRLGRLLRVTLPSAAPYLATGLRISSSVAIILALTAELVVGVPGLGRSINTAASGGAYSLMYSLIICAGLLGLGLNLVFQSFEHRLLRWHPSQREELGV